MSDIGLADLINKVKEELLTPEAPGDPIPLLSVDEVNLIDQQRRTFKNTTASASRFLPENSKY